MKFRSTVNLLLCLTLCLGTISASFVVESQIQTSNWNNGSNSSNGTNVSNGSNSSNGTNATSGYILSNFKWDQAYLSTFASYLELIFVGIEGRYIPGKPHPVYVTGVVKKPFKLVTMVLYVTCNDLAQYSTYQIMSGSYEYPEGALAPILAFEKLPFTPVVGNCSLGAKLVAPEGRLFKDTIARFKFEKAQ